MDFTNEQLRGIEAAVGKLCEAAILLPEEGIASLLEAFETSQRTLPIVEFKKDISAQMQALRVSALMTRTFLEFHRSLTSGMNAIMSVERPKGIVT